MNVAATVQDAISLPMANKQLTGDRLWERLVSQIIKDSDFQNNFDHEDVIVQQDWAERIFDQTVSFLRLCAFDPDGHYGPSPLIDIGWHTFILHTKEYAEFCYRTIGHFVHHCPNDTTESERDDGSVDRTVAALRRYGLTIDVPLWFETADCKGKKCYSDCNQASLPNSF